MYDECQACTVYLTCIIYNSFHSSLGLYIGGLETEKSQENILWVNSVNKVDSWNSNSGFHDYKTLFFFFFFFTISASHWFSGITYYLGPVIVGSGMSDQREEMHGS